MSFDEFNRRFGIFLVRFTIGMGVLLLINIAVVILLLGIAGMIPR